MGELDYDKVLEELVNHSKNPETNQFPDILERYLQNIAKTGDTIFPWIKVKPFIRKKIEIVIDDFHSKYPLKDEQTCVPNCDPFDYDSIKSNILQCFDWFCAAPFTIQRLCELLIEPYRHYKRTDKFMRGIEKNIIVVSTIQPQPNKYSTPETIEKKTSFRDLYPHFPLTSASSMLSRSPPSNSSPSSSSSSSCSSSASASPSQTSNSMINGFDNSIASLSQHHHHPHNINNGNHSPHHHPQHLINNGSFENNPYSLAHLTNSNSSASSISSFYSDSKGANSATLNQESALAHYGTGHPLPKNTAPLQQLDSFTSVFVQSNYLSSMTVNHSHHPQSGLIQNRQQQRQTDWSTSSYRLTSISASDSNDDNENIIVDDDYEHNSSRNNLLNVCPQNRSESKLFEEDLLKDRIFNQNESNKSALNFDSIKNQVDQNKEKEDDDDEVENKSSVAENVDEKQEIEKIDDNNFSESDIEIPENESQEEDSQETFDEPNKKLKLDLENDEKKSDHEDQKECAEFETNPTKLETDSEISKFETNNEDTPMEMIGSSNLIESKIDSSPMMTNFDIDINNSDMDQQEDKMMTKDDDDLNDGVENEEEKMVIGNGQSNNFIQNNSNENEDQIMSEPMEQE
ncbi:Serine/threonine-protein phosphatase 4 regulatory subunit 2 [Sarcoptes scabiei]|uniref:Serine/threonine-protein phosphatase 4 regulatory subunit 2 n=1 Tax=Sarcoptes scabiei TaxID=52283 RepID=A0A834R7Y5_SARSC|nr:Serine/threonine-protein phosphatase 4 regulatory subunit 2 [Sarcoptes scabiei]